MNAITLIKNYTAECDCYSQSSVICNPDEEIYGVWQERLPVVFLESTKLSEPFREGAPLSTWGRG